MKSTKEKNVNTYMMPAGEMTDEQIQGWLRNFNAQPPTMDYMQEWSWAGSVVREAQRRGIERP